jgi:hypothetical protein
MKRRSDAPYVWLEAALNLLLGSALLWFALTTNRWSMGLMRVSAFGAAVVLGVLCVARAWCVVARHYRE